MTRRRLMTMALFVLAATAAGASTEPDQVLITYDLKMGQKEISGVSRELEWSFIALDEDRARMRLRVPIDSFQSGHSGFDSKLRKALDSEHHPMVEIEGVAREGQLDGTLELAGTARPVSVKLHLERVGGNVIAVASLEIDLRDYGVALEGVDPHMSVDALVRLSPSPKAVLAGGFVRQR
jgi:polyisoprenoid-binding protein YceI